MTSVGKSVAARTTVGAFAERFANTFANVSPNARV